ncbi:rRNA methyltransferase 3, mitochondrial-like [Polyodon spathula]|uniref:rRNA methyltransferase 3, mitochondrial-like n=1 Tax=Polyodon spathula TaxID=7913 RepID=UPI001B7EDA03|nr:rRNA methyltransferase 3, mitochondrial-like [Polyodon spathula]
MAQCSIACMVQLSDLTEKSKVAEQPIRLLRKAKLPASMAAFMRSVSRGLTAAESFRFLTIRENQRIDPKRYVRALRRTPVRVIYPENEAAETKTRETAAKIKEKCKADQFDHEPLPKNWRRDDSSKNKPKPQPGGTNEKRPRQAFNSESLKNSVRENPPPEDTRHSDELDGLRYEKAYPGDKRLAKVVTIVKSRRFREQHGKVLLEGRRLIADALGCGAVLQTLFFSSLDALKELPLDKLRRVNLVKVKFDDIKVWSDLVTPQGIMAIFARPDHSKMTYPAEQLEHSLPLSLICDNIRDPGNLGTILRCAAGAGCSRALLTKGCVDAWEPKVLRASMGAHFRFPVINNLEWDEIPNYLPGSATVHLADNCSSTSESRGEDRLKAGDYGWVSSRPNPKRIGFEEHSLDSDSDSDSDSDLSLPEVKAQLYHEGWAQNQTALVIGGETHGLSLEALQLAERTEGRRLLVPMVPGVDSLNSAMAASILLFEGKRQLEAVKSSPVQRQ